MAVYVDQITDYKGSVKGYVGRVSQHWCHMYADSLDELHEMAAKIGMKRSWFQEAHWLHLCHYDLVPSKRAKAVALGAIEVKSLAYMRDRIAKGLHEVPVTVKAQALLAAEQAGQA